MPMSQCSRARRLKVYGVDDYIAISLPTLYRYDARGLATPAFAGRKYATAFTSAAGILSFPRYYLVDASRLNGSCSSFRRR